MGSWKQASVHAHLAAPWWSGLLIALSLAALSSCSSNDAPDGLDTGPINPNGAGPTGPCSDGTSRLCSITLGENNGILSCYTGTQRCTKGKWGQCSGGRVTSQAYPARPRTSLRSNTPGALRSQALSTPVDCENNPCDPTCQTFDEQPDAGITPDPGSSPPIVIGGSVTSLPGGFENKGLKDNSHPPGFSPCTGPADCQFDHYCDTDACNSKGCGQCVKRPTGSYDSCGAANLTVGVPCEDYLPICNRGDVTAPAGLEVVIISGNSNQLQRNLSACTGFRGSVAGSCTTSEPIPPGECINASDCLPYLSGTRGIVVNAADYAPPTPITECECSDNWSVAHGGGGSCETEAGGGYEELTHKEQYAPTCPEGTTVQWGYLSYNTQTPYNSAGSSSVQIQVQVASDASELSADCSNCITVADIPASNPEYCPFSGGASGCPISIYDALGGVPEANKGVLEVTFTLNASPAGANPVFFSEDFANNYQGWTLQNEWEIGSAQSSSGQHYGNADPSSDQSPSSDNGVAGVVIGGNAARTLHGLQYLTSPPIYLSGITGDVGLQFFRWLNSDYMPFMRNTLEVYDGSGWQTLWETGGDPGIRDNAWNQQTLDITDYANSAFQFRIGYSVEHSEVYSVGSWNLDDVTIVGSGSEQLPPTVVSWELSYSCIDSE